MSRKDLLKLASMETYEAPELPTLTEAKPELLKKVPSRWKNKAVIATTVGLFGVATLVGCSSQAPSFTPIEDTGIPILASPSKRTVTYCSDLHFGGSGGAPIYVAYLTEQEALNIIGQQFFEAGLLLEEAMPRPRINASDIYYELGNFGEAWDEGSMFPNYVEMQFIDTDSEVGIVLVKDWSWWLGSSCTENIRESIKRRFQREHNLSVHVIFETGGELGWLSADRSWEEINALWDETSQEYIISDEIRAELLEEAEALFVLQIQALIDQLRTEGFIE